MMAMPVAMPTLHLIGRSAPDLSVLTPVHNSSPARTACSASYFVCSGIAEKDERGIPETADDEPVVAIDRL
jgi:hypothetical protein